MENVLDTTFGYIGSSLLILSMIPQLYRTFKTRSVKDFSPIFLGIQLFTAGTLLTYSILIKQIPLIYGNSGILTELILLSYMKWKWRNRSYEMKHNLVDMRNKFSPCEDNLNRIDMIEKLTKTKELLNTSEKDYDLEKLNNTKQNIRSRKPSIHSVSEVFETDSNKSEEENEIFQEILGYSHLIPLYESSI